MINVPLLDQKSDAGTASKMPRHWTSVLRTESAFPVVNANQLTSLNAMISYIAAKTGQSEFRIERSLADQFGVANAKLLPAQAFDDAVRYLADILDL